MRRRGSISIELLIALIGISILIPIVYISVRILVNHNYFNQDAQDEIALYQLRKNLLIVEDVNVINGTLYANLAGETIEIRTKNNHCYMTPGTQIYFANVDEGYFTIEDGWILYTYLREGKWIERVCGYE